MMCRGVILAGIVVCLGLLPLRVTAEEVPGSQFQVPSADGMRIKTWKTVEELSAEEKARLDLRVETPRDSLIPYLPAEKFPFSAPYSAEEMGLRAMEFPHSPFWNCTLIDIAASVTNTGFMDQRVTIIPILYLSEGGFAEQLYSAKPGQEVYRWLSQSVSPPERYGNQTL